MHAGHLATEAAENGPHASRRRRRLIHLTCPPEEAIGGVGLLVPLAAADHGPTPIDCSLDRQSHLLTHCTSIHRSTKTQQQNRRRHQRKLLLGGGVSTVLSLASMNVPGILSRPYYACILAVTGIVRNDGRCPGSLVCTRLKQGLVGYRARSSRADCLLRRFNLNHVLPSTEIVKLHGQICLGS